ncbi:enoyl-CoA-hydratase DpgB [Streptomyces sp. SID3343]|uniref:enoyl-CoA-hydratase DpgB n=1 Tax=Streptomyces sp. SID3343 TaxID=2690260 RepID=UPI0013701B02|nr:enoyl-CoA-hydratase DpgB [Streptomyces sp. SID3343]MYV98433.1 enoyl-CoA hydratase/isomerase family protein [Streptomyces sp. SID3343]
MSSGSTPGGVHQGPTHLEIGDEQRPTPALIAAVEALCDSTDNAVGQPPAVLRLGSRSTPSAPAEPSTGLAIHLVSRWERALRRLERIGAVTIAVAEGRCAGPALEALLSCDYRIATRDLRLEPSTTLGEPWPGMVVHRLANQLGVARARQLVLFGTGMSAAQALEVGLVDELTDDVPTAVATRIALLRPLTGSEVAIRRRLLLEATATSFEDALGAHLAACDRTLRRIPNGTAS